MRWIEAAAGPGPCGAWIHGRTCDEAAGIDVRLAT